MKKGYWFLIAIVVLSFVIYGGEYFYYQYKLNHLIPHEIEEYQFSISYPETYQEYRKDSERYDDGIQEISVTVAEQSIAEAMENMNMSENVLSLVSKKSKTRLVVDGIHTPKSTLDLEEICKRYAVMFKIYNEELNILEKENEIIDIQGTEVGKVTLTVKGEKQSVIVTAFLFSLDDREMTVTFITSEAEYEKAIKEIDRIIHSVKF